jgi:gamma-glutamylcyclotransferase (GGCT)/AIG2-like uncharacterized protein YtfP
MKDERQNVFAYGTLKDSKFVRKLLKKTVKGEFGELKDYKKIRISELKYPLAVKRKDGVIRGKLLAGLTKQDIKKIDEWEKTPQNYYRKTLVKVRTRQGIKEAIAYTASEETLKEKQVE